MQLYEKINKYVETTKNKSWHDYHEAFLAIRQEILDYLAYKHNTGYKFFIFINEVIDYLAKYQILLTDNSYIDNLVTQDEIDFNCIKYIVDRGTWHRKYGNCFEINNEELALIKNNELDKAKIHRTLRRQQIKAKSTTKKEPKVELNWITPKQIENLQKEWAITKDSARKKEIMEYIKDLREVMKNINPTNIKKWLKQKSINVDEYSHIELDNKYTENLIVYLYKTENDYKAGRYVFSGCFKVNDALADVPKSLSILNNSFLIIEDVYLEKIKGFSELSQYKIIAFNSREQYHIQLYNIPEPLIVQFMKTLMATKDERLAFNAIKYDLINDCVIYYENDFITDDQTGHNYIVTKDRVRDIIVEDSFYKTDFNKYEKLSRFAEFCTDLEIESIKYNINAFEFITTAKINQELAEHISKKDFVYQSIMENDIYELKGDKLIISIDGLGSFLPHEWFNLANENDNNLSYVVQNYLLSFHAVSSHKGKDEVGGGFTFNKKYY